MISDARAGAADPDRIDQFDGLRACAFLAVFLHHAVHAPLLWMGVDQFFVLSGFLITRNLLSLRVGATPRAAFGVFYFRRALRIIPPYYVALTAIFLTGGAVSGAGWYYAFASNVHDAIHGANPGPLEAMWSIAVEEQFYLVWPCLVLLVPRRWLGVTFGAVLAAAPLCRLAVAPMGFDAVYRLTSCRMDLLAAGALLALIEQRDPTWFARNLRRFVAVAAIALATFAALSLAVPTFRTRGDRTLFNVVGFALSGVFFACVLAYVRGASSGLAWRALRNPVLRYIGRISYMAYLIHILCLVLANCVVHGTAVVAALALAFTIAGASASWYALEAPVLTLRYLVKPRRRAVTA
jgi:peptidoglycan/LPS O-acetylase OafA/YrhL